MHNEGNTAKPDFLSDKKWVTFDVETLKWSEEVDGGWSNIPGFGLSVLCLRDHGGIMSHLTEPEIPVIEEGNGIWPITAQGIAEQFDSADVIIGFNTLRFDWQVLGGTKLFSTEQLRRWKAKSYDILDEFAAVAGHRISLNVLATHLFNTPKTGDGRKAVDYWQLAEFLDSGDAPGYNGTDALRVIDSLRQDVIRYCAHDVELTYQIAGYLYGGNGELTYPQRNETFKHIQLDIGLL